MLTMAFDLRRPTFAVPAPELYRAALDQASWADEHGFDAIEVMEHHASPDGYLPSPLVFAAAVAARTKVLRIWVSALVLPLHDPVAVAEDVAVLDLISNGRVTLVVAAGYREVEFSMFGVDFARRGALLEEGVDVLRTAWTGDPFTYRGRPAQVLPRPVQERLPIVFGGSSRVGARRAARLGDGFRPSRADIIEDYLAELAALGRPAPTIVPAVTWHPFVHVSRDPERDWVRIAPHAVHESRSYADWTRAQPTAGRHPIDPATLRASGMYRVVTPEEALRLALGGQGLHLRPLVGGLDPALAWESLHLIESDVLPYVERTRSTRR